MTQKIEELEQKVSQVFDIGSGYMTQQAEKKKPRTRSTPVWLGSQPPGPPTRVFPKETGEKRFKAPPTDLSDPSTFPSLDKALDPTSQAFASLPPMSIPIEMVDSSLDGITLKSTGLPPSVVAKISSSQEGSARSSPKDSNPKQPPRPVSFLPPDQTDKNAEHTPTAVAPSDSDVSGLSSAGTDIPAEYQPLVPHTTLEPVERPPTHLPQIDEDPELTGPLTLLNDKDLDRVFLQELDEKLMQEAQRPRADSLTSPTSMMSGSDPEHDSEPEPELRFRRGTTNFGTAFGSRTIAVDGKR